MLWFDRGYVVVWNRGRTMEKSNSDNVVKNQAEVEEEMSDKEERVYKMKVGM